MHAGRISFRIESEKNELSENGCEAGSCTLAASRARSGVCLARKRALVWPAHGTDQLTEAPQSLQIRPLITLEATPRATHPLFAEMAYNGQE